MTMPVSPTVTVAPGVPMTSARTGAPVVPMASARTAAPAGSVAAARNAGTAGTGTVPVLGAGTSVAGGPGTRTRTAPGSEARTWPAPAAGTVPLLLSPGRLLPGTGGEIVIACTAVAESGAGSAGRLGRWVRGALCRGHRPIIARTKGALCSPRHNSR